MFQTGADGKGYPKCRNSAKTNKSNISEIGDSPIESFVYPAQAILSNPLRKPS